MASTSAAASAQTRSFRAKHESLYASERDCARYDELCRCQDDAGALVAALLDVVPALRQKKKSCCRVADVGAGTGKLARLLAPHVGFVSVSDRSAEAIAIARASCDAAEFADCAMEFHVADLRALPLADASVDVAIAGWAVSYLKSEYEEWHADGSYGGPWREEVDRALAELERILAPGGTLVLLETMGTATANPQRAGSHLYAHFRASGLEEQCVRTDYRFSSKRMALDTLRFFFGKGVATRASALLDAGKDAASEALPCSSAAPAAPSCDDVDGPCTIPECTGMWWRHKLKTEVDQPSCADAHTTSAPGGVSEESDARDTKKLKSKS